MEVGQGKACVVGGISLTPVRWRGDLVGGICGGLVQLCVALPSNTLICHVVGYVPSIGSRGVEQDRAEKGVVEYGVCDKTARIVGLASVTIDRQRRAVAATDATVVAKSARQLVLIVRLDISSVVLVKVCEAVVQEYVRSNVVGKIKLQLADSGLDVSARTVVDGGRVARPLHGIGRRAVLEITRDVARGNWREGWI